MKVIQHGICGASIVSVINEKGCGSLSPCLISNLSRFTVRPSSLAGVPVFNRPSFSPIRCKLSESSVLAGSPIAAGRELQLTYDSLTGVPPALDVPISDGEVAALGQIRLTEKPPEVGFGG